MLLYLWIAVGGALGSVARVALGDWVNGQMAGAFPWGTLAVNVLGSLVIGFLAGLEHAEHHLMTASPGRQLLILGFCGGFTTFSTFSLQTFGLLTTGAWGSALANIGGSVVTCLAAAALGWVLAALVVRLLGLSA